MHLSRLRVKKKKETGQYIENTSNKSANQTIGQPNDMEVEYGRTMVQNSQARQEGTQQWKYLTKFNTIADLIRVFL